MRPQLPFGTIAGMMLALSLAAGLNASERIGNFMLIDQHGQSFELHYHRDAPAVVLMAHRSGSAYAQAAAQALADVQAEFTDVPVYLINAVAGEGRSEAAADMAAAGISLPVLDDRTQLVTEALGLRHAGEVVVIDSHRWQLLYRGPVLESDESEQANRVARILEQQGQRTAEIAAEIVAMPVGLEEERLHLPALAERDRHAQISYSDTIAPLLLEKCADCHRPGGIAPFAMNSHPMVQGFAPMIRETVLTGRMPPWHADPEVGDFAHDMSLTVAQQQQLVHWIEAGARRGDGPDPLLAVTPLESSWALGEPDLIIDLPAFDVPATGVLDYQNFEVPNPLGEDVWVRAVQIIPGDRQVVHHVIATVGEPGSLVPGGAITNSLLQPQLMTFVPGNELYEYPEDTGLRVPAGASFFAQMHYTPYGRETADQSRIGLWFADETPAHVLQHYSIVNINLRIPPGAAAHQEQAYYQFRRDAVIYALFPHAHYRGRASDFSLRYPDGSESLVLSVPNYDFNWQRYFQFEEPITVPAGTFLIHRTTFDNSTNNLANPDPEVLVRFGEQTWEEMLYGGISYRYAEAQEGDHLVDELDYLTSIAMGFMDTNMDGRVSLEEMPEASRERLALPFLMLDSNRSGGLEFEQFREFMAQGGQRMLR